MNVGDRIKRKRKEKSMTQAELATAAGVKRTTISAAEIGVNNPSSSTLTLIASALGCTVAELLGEEQPAAADPDGLTPRERQLIQDFRQLNEQGRQYVLQSMAMALELSKSERHALADVGLSG